MSFDPVDKPKHYNSHPSGIEAIQIVQHMGFCLGNVIKYVWRADLKGGVEDLKKARYYLDLEIKRRTEVKDDIGGKGTQGTSGEGAGAG